MNVDKEHKKLADGRNDDLPGNLKANPFSVPEGYFRDFPEKIAQRIENEGRNQSSRVIRVKRRTWLAAAAVVIILVTGSIFLFPDQDPHETRMISYSSISLQDIEEAGILVNLEDFTLVDYFPEEDIAGLQNEILEGNTEFSRQDIEQFLLQSNEIEHLINNY